MILSLKLSAHLTGFVRQILMAKFNKFREKLVLASDYCFPDILLPGKVE
jgi:hypothetical protein